MSRISSSVMAMACGALASFGLESQRMVVGDVGAVYGLLKQFKLSERATYFLLYSMAELRDGETGLEFVRARGHELGLFDSGALDRMVEILQDSDQLYEKDGAQWFRSSSFGDDKARRRCAQ